MTVAMARYRSLACDDEARRARVADHERLNGIDYLELGSDRKGRPVLAVYFIAKTSDQGKKSLKKLLLELDGNRSSFAIEGGVRIHGLSAKEVERDNKNDHLNVTLDRYGDFSPYTLVIRHDDIDPAYARCGIDFKVDCPSPLDSGAGKACEPPPEGKTPPIDYLAKDYASFRQALLDLLARTAPGWRERNPADLGMALVELLSYVADRLSYYQDAVANEAFLETACQRISVRRHARLIDYRMHDGVSARLFAHFQVDTRRGGIMPAGTQLLTRITEPLGGRVPGVVIGQDWAREAGGMADAVFETVGDLYLHRRFNAIPIHTWGNRQCCLPRGTTSLDLEGDLTETEAQLLGCEDVSLPRLLERGDLLLLEEVKGPATGEVADADPAHRQVVRLTQVETLEDPLEGVRLTRISWDRADRLTFPLCLSARLPGQSYVDGISVARGNLVLADHGRRIDAELHPVDPDSPEARGLETGPGIYRFRLREGPLSLHVPPLSEDAPVKRLQEMQPHLAEPQVVALHSSRDGERWTDSWKPVAPTLLDSGPFQRHFVVETENDGHAWLRFGNDRHGTAPEQGSYFRAAYRIGIGSAGNIGADALYHIVRPADAERWPGIAAVRNPLAAWGGMDPESLEQVKRLSAAALHANQQRAVTEEDYAEVAARHPEVQRAVATFRWTGSWHTVFVTIDPLGTSEASPELRERVHGWVERFTQADYDLEIAAPAYVPIEIEARVCVAAEQFRLPVREALLEVLGNGVLPDGSRGLFHPDSFSFAEPLYLSRVYAAMEAVTGVESVEITRFKRLGESHEDERARGYIPIGRLEVLRLDNQPNFPEHGVLRLEMQGDK